jgi:hypothetical protein
MGGLQLFIRDVIHETKGIGSRLGGRKKRIEKKESEVSC